MLKTYRAAGETLDQATGSLAAVEAAADRAADQAERIADYVSLFGFITVMAVVFCAMAYIGSTLGPVGE
jgi:hypothetical protein